MRGVAQFPAFKMGVRISPPPEFPLPSAQIRGCRLSFSSLNEAGGNVILAGLGDGNSSAVSGSMVISVARG